MQQKDFTTSIEDMAAYFGWSPPANVIAMYVKELERHDVTVSKRAIKKVFEEHTRFPKLPEFKAILKNLSGTKEATTYDTDIDHRFPMKYLWAGFDILMESGIEDFNTFCDKVSMPRDDRAGVLGKYRYQTDPEYKAWVNQQKKQIKQKLSNFGRVR